MKPRNLALMLAAVGVGLVAYLAMSRLLTPPPPRTVTVWAAACDLPSGTYLSETTVEHLLSPRTVGEADALEAGYLAYPDTAPLVKHRLNRLIRNGDAVRLADLTVAQAILWRPKPGRVVVDIPLEFHHPDAGFIAQCSRVGLIGCDADTESGRSRVVADNAFVVASIDWLFRNPPPPDLTPGVLTLDVSLGEFANVSRYLYSGRLRVRRGRGD